LRDEPRLIVTFFHPKGTYNRAGGTWGKATGAIRKRPVQSAASLEQFNKNYGTEFLYAEGPGEKAGCRDYLAAL
jgi:hypothetical protein